MSNRSSLQMSPAVTMHCAPGDICSCVLLDVSIWGRAINGRVGGCCQLRYPMGRDDAAEADDAISPVLMCSRSAA